MGPVISRSLLEWRSWLDTLTEVAHARSIHEIDSGQLRGRSFPEK